jgi:hypothetical protein
VRTWKNYVTVQDGVVKLSVSLEDSDKFDRNFSCLSDLTPYDIDTLITNLEAQKLVLKKIQGAL